MTKEERDRLAELAAMAWAARKNDEAHSDFLGEKPKGIQVVWVSDGLAVVRISDLIEVVTDWANQKPHYKDVAEWLHKRYEEMVKDHPGKNPTLEFEMPVKNPTYAYKMSMSSSSLFHLSRKVKGQIKYFIIGVLATALFNWIF